MPSRVIYTLETHFFGSAPSLNAVRHATGWLIRSSGGYTKRGNSASPLDPSEPLNDAVLKDSKGNLAAPHVIRITPLAHPDDDHFLKTRGWERIDPSVVMYHEIDPSKPTIDRTDIRIQTITRPTTVWVDGFASSSSLSPSHTETFRSTMNLIQPPFHPFYLTLFDTANQAIGYGQAVISNGIAGLYNIVVPSSYRGRGYGRAVTQALLNEVRKAGVRPVYLQVTEKNVVGRRLYRSLGFKEEYKYHYRTIPEAQM